MGLGRVGREEAAEEDARAAAEDARLQEVAGDVLGEEPLDEELQVDEIRDA